MTGDFNQTLDYSEFFGNLKIKDNVSFVAEVKRDDENILISNPLLGLI